MYIFIIIKIYEALREKMSLLGKLYGILFKFHILKIEFLHEKIIFFGLDFSLARYECVAFKNEVYSEHLPKIDRTVRSSFQFSNNFVFSSKKSKNTQKYPKTERWPSRSVNFWEMLIVELIFERYTTVPC